MQRVYLLTKFNSNKNIIFSYRLEISFICTYVFFFNLIHLLETLYNCDFISEAIKTAWSNSPRVARTPLVFSAA